MAVINGDNGPNALPATSGDDVINGLGGNDTITVTAGRDFADGGDGEDILEIRYGSAGVRVDVDGFTQNAFVDTAGTGSFGDSTRRVDGTRFEHIDAITGSGDDRLEGI